MYVRLIDIYKSFFFSSCKILRIFQSIAKISLKLNLVLLFFKYIEKILNFTKDKKWLVDIKKTNIQISFFQLNILLFEMFVNNF